MHNKLPNGWVKTTLGEIADLSRDRASPMDDPEMRYVGLEHIEPQSMRLLGCSSARETRSSSVRFSKGDVLYGKMRPYLNKVWVAEFDGVCSAEFLVFQKHDVLNSQFLAMRLNAQDFVTFANGQVSGERPRVDFEKLSGFPILLPPIDEQERIVAKLDASLSGLERAERASRRAQERLKRYRSAVLNAAVTGELTHDWRAAQQSLTTGNIETGKSLLQRILTIRRDHWEKAQLRRLRESGKSLTKDKLMSSYSEPIGPSISDLPKLPGTWSWASLDMIAEIGSGISVSQNRRVKHPVKLPYLRVANVLRGYFDLSEMKTIRVEKDRVADYLLHIGDVLFTEGGDRDKLGRGWVWEGQIRKCVHQNHVFRARLFDPSVLNPKLLSHWGNTFGQSFFLQHGTQTTNLASINRGVLSRLPVPVPPTGEQGEILLQIERRLVSASDLDSTLSRQLERANFAHIALLRQAFTGRLVPQDPNDEPASILLERIGKERKAEAEKPRGKRMARSKAEVRTEGRQDLLTILKRNGGRMTPEQLFHAAGFDPSRVDDFYRELTLLRDKLREEKPSSSEARSWPGRAHVFLQLKTGAEK